MAVVTTVSTSVLPCISDGIEDSFFKVKNNMLVMQKKQFSLNSKLSIFHKKKIAKILYAKNLKNCLGDFHEI